MRPLPFLPALLLLTLPLASHADDTPPPKPTAPQLYKRAVGHLNEGLWFEKAIADLTQAVKLDPQNSDYHLALGCAEADRAGSLAYAAWMTDQLLNARQQYALQYAAWQAGQNDPKDEAYGKPEPVAPPDIQFQVKDDLHYLRLTGKQAAARVIELGTAAQAEWKQAVLLAPTRQARAQAESVQGWGLLSEQRILQFTGYPKAKVPTAPQPMDAVAAFQAATKDDPSRAAYWEGLGDAYPYLDSDDTAHDPDQVRAWQKALSLAPGNTGLGFKLYQVQSRRRETDPLFGPQPALKTLKTVAASDPGNSLLHYGLAALLFKQVHYSDVIDRVDPSITDFSQPVSKEQTDAWRNKVVQDLAAKDDNASERIASDALDAIEQGNRGSRYEVPEYAPPVPKILLRAWDYWDSLERMYDNPFVMAAKLRELARAVSGYSRVAAQLGDEDGAVRAAHACIGIGFRLAGDWPLRGETPGDDTVVQVSLGTAIASIGYAGLQKIYEHFGDTASAQATAAEYDALKQKQKAYMAAINRLIEQDEATGSAPLWNNY